MSATASNGEARPYGPWMTRALEPMHAIFGAANRLAVPILHSWLAPWLSTRSGGRLLVLRTTGRRSGLPREAPLGYVVRDDAILVCAGFGPDTAWYRNLLADPEVSVVLPGGTFRAIAEPVTDPDEYRAGIRALVGGLGVVGRLTLGDLRDASSERFEVLRAGLPLIRVRPTAIEAGPPLVPAAAWLGIGGLLLGAAGLGWRAGRGHRAH